jgi:hypothetical protein
LVKLPAVFLILSVLSACVAGSTGVVVASEYCRIAQPISYDGKADTPETVGQIEKHNSQYVCLCENDCPAGAK